MAEVRSGLSSALTPVARPTCSMYLYNLFLVWSSKCKIRQSSLSLELSNILHVGMAVLTVLSIGPSYVATLESGLAQGTRTDHSGSIDYDYGDDTSDYLNSKNWREQSMLGKGEKISDELVKLTDAVDARSDVGWTDNIGIDVSKLTDNVRQHGVQYDSGRTLTSKSGVLSLDTNPGIVPLDTNPGIVPLDTNPGIVPLDTNPGIVPLDANPGIVPLDTNPGIVPLYTKPGIVSMNASSDTGALQRTMNHTICSGFHGRHKFIKLPYDQDTGDSPDYGSTSSKAGCDDTSAGLDLRAISTSQPGKAPVMPMSSDGKLPRNIESTDLSVFGETPSLSLEDRPIIYIAGLFPLSEDIPAGSVGRGVLPAVRIALEHVNHDAHVNRKYILKMASNDTRCDMAVATRAFFDMMADGQTTTAMLFGDVCYNVTGPMVQIANQWGMFQLSYADTNPMLSDRDQFPNFYRTVPSDSDFNPARLALLQHFNWTSVGTIFQDAKLGQARHGYASTKFDSLVEKHKINISVVESFADDPDAAIKKLKMQDVRIIVGNFDQAMARKVFCSARQNSMYGSKHQWIILGTYDADWWTVSDDTITCSAWELNDTIHGYLATDVLPLSTGDDVTESGRTSADYLRLYNEARGLEFSKYHGYAYDGVWVVAKALDRLLDDASVTSDSFRGPIIGRALNETNFLGVTGRVQFLNGDRVGSMTILQMQFGEMVKVGEYHALTHALDLSEGKLIVWRDGKPPVDRSIKIEELRHVSFPVYIGFVVMAALGITMAVLFLALNIHYRRHRYIKMSSPNMNNLIIIGCILCYLSIILLGADTDHQDRQLFSYWCIARSWTLALGFTLAFGAMFSKTWRVHAIFTNIKLNKKVIKDYKLLLIVLVLVSVDVVILVTWQIVDPFDKAVKRLTPEVYVDVEIIPKLDYCSSRSMEVWLGALYAYKGLLLAFGCFLAWETRHVSIPALNDSQYIGMSVYNVVIMCVCGAAVSFVIEDRPTQSFIIIGLFIIFCTTITLCLVFLPKIIQLRRNPTGDEQRLRATLRKSRKSKKPEHSVHREKVRATCEENRRLRGFMEQKANELENLLEQLGDDGSGEELGLRSALLHRKVLELRQVDGSPGKGSIKSCSACEVECMSTYSEGSATTFVYLNDESPPPSTLLKNRPQTSRLYSEAIEMAGIRFNHRKSSLTIPPAAEEETEDDPFGGVYLGPSESPTNEDTSDRDQEIEDAAEETRPFNCNFPNTRPVLCRTDSAILGGAILDSSTGAQGTPLLRRQLPRSLRFRRHSTPLTIWTIAESYLEDSLDTVQVKDTRPLVEPCSCVTMVYPENAAMTSPMTPSPMTTSPHDQSQHEIPRTNKPARICKHC